MFIPLFRAVIRPPSAAPIALDMADDIAVNNAALFSSPPAATDWAASEIRDLSWVVVVAVVVAVGAAAAAAIAVAVAAAAGAGEVGVGTAAVVRVVVVVVVSSCRQQ